MSADLPHIYTLIEEIKTAWRHRQSAPGAIGLEVRRALASLEPPPAARGGFPLSQHPITRHIHAAFAGGTRETAAIIEALKPVVYCLPWQYTYPARADAPGLGQNIAFAEIIGPAAPLPSERVCLGLTLIAPGTRYPEHHHPATELYHVLAGSALWTADGETQRQPPGAFILHPSQIEHAMETREEPLLAVYAWTGPDVRTTSVYAASAPAFRQRLL
jgi:quercetin dioxygenase-like cupin family protein